MRHPCKDSAAPSPKAEYDRGLWRYRLLSPLRSASAETPTGGVPFRPLPLSLRNSNCGSGNYSSRQRSIPPRVSSASGASKTGIGSTSRNGCLRSGASPWIQTSVPPRDHPSARIPWVWLFSDSIHRYLRGPSFSQDATTKDRPSVPNLIPETTPFLYVQASEFARLPGRSYRCSKFRRAAETFTSGQNVLRCLCTHRIC